jgi:putative hydrolase of the HAD superfamily
MPARAVLFDLDDTLLDHSGIQRTLALQLRQRHRVFAAADPEALAQLSMRLLDELWPRVLAGAMTLHEARTQRYRRMLQTFGEADDDAETLAHWHARAYIEAETVVPGALALVEAARARGLRLAIVSNNTRAEQQRKLDRHGLAPHFEALVVAADHGIAKPQPRLFHLALEALGVAAADSVMVGDSWPLDIEGARAAGIRAVWFNRHGEQPSGDPSVAQLSSFDDTESALPTIVG